MRLNKELNCQLSRSLLGYALLTLVLLAHQASLGEGRVIATYNSVENDNSNNSPYFKRSPQERLPHSPYTKPTSTPGGEFSGNSAPTRKRSLFSHVNGDIVAEEAAVKVVILQQQKHHSSEEAVPASGKPALVPVPVLAPPVYHMAPGDKMVLSGEKYEVPESAKVEPEDLDFWGDDEQHTLIEPRYPSIDLFDEEVEEMLELGEDGLLREVFGDESSYRRNVHRDDLSEDRLDQVWMVDEWEEELEGDMDELMDWADEDGELNHRRPIRDNVMGSRRLHDQGSIRNALLDEDEASPFQRLFSDSWLF
ncbi:hypothetical protein BGZ58_006654 [Dissophora ornata]|nr:hypothetical protein BGZ58_006654 [Dissophora ornata]